MASMVQWPDQHFYPLPHYQRLLLNKTKTKIQVGLCWQIIQLDQPGCISEEDAIKALHFDMAKEHRNIAKCTLEEIYITTATAQLHVSHASPQGCPK